METGHPKEPVALIFDTETTDKDNPEIIQAAWIGVVMASSDSGASKIFVSRSEGYKVAHDQMYKPSVPISMGAMATHHIMDEDLADMPDSSTFALPEGLEFMIGHKVEFDWVAAGSPEGIKLIDTLPIAQTIWPESDAHSLSALMYFLDREHAREKIKNAHSAAADVKNCAFVLGRILDKVPNVKTMDDLHRLSEYCKVPTVMRFGKHAGANIADIPKDYKDWMLKQPDVDPYLRQAFTSDGAQSIDLLAGVEIGKPRVRSQAKP